MRRRCLGGFRIAFRAGILILTIVLIMPCTGLLCARAVRATPAATPSATTSPTNDQEIVASVPLFARFASDGATLRGYRAQVQLVAGIRKFFFGFRLGRSGTVSFEQPDDLQMTIRSVPSKYTGVFSELGTPRSWPILYNLRIVRRDTSEPQMSYSVRGTPVLASDVEYMECQLGDEASPIKARWILRSGWTITSSIDLETVDGYLVPKHERTDIVGHGYRIHTDMTYSDYVFTEGPARESLR